LGRVAQIILEPAERGCPSRSTFDNPKTRGISCAHLAILPAAGGTPALRSIWATRPLAKAEVTVPSLDDWEKEWGKNTQSVKPQLTGIAFLDRQKARINTNAFSSHTSLN
jgi:hypothetical protein